MIKDWGDIENAKILVIGHDPRLQNSDTVAEYCLFANYYFKKLPTNAKEKSKFNLAKSSFEQILYLTNNKYKIKEIFFTNLCNEELPHAPKNKTVLITDEKAIHGIEHIQGILEKSQIEYIFPASLQVNYLLQKHNFYNSNNGFIEATMPKKKGLISNPPYFESSKFKTFQLICGNIYEATFGQYKVIPILHPKQFPLRENLKSYQTSYDKVRDYFANI